MKKLVLIFVSLSAITAAALYLKHSKPVPAAAAETATAPAPEPAPVAATDETPQPKTAVAPVPQQPVAEAPKPSPAPEPAVAEPKPEDTKAAALARSIDQLVSPQLNFYQKQAIWKQLRESGQMDAAIAELKQRAADNPSSPEYPTALGNAYLSQIQSAPDQNHRAILAIQADDSFDEALKRDPSNWDAQFTKAVALSYWPSGLGKGPEVIQRLTDLINQQETMSPEPRFASTYLILGEQYQKAGNSDYAQATWQAGATQFPANAELQKRVAGAGH